jgi:Gas vesicle protein K
MSQPNQTQAPVQTGADGQPGRRVRYRLDADDPQSAERGLAALVLTLVELLRQLMERQALRRVEDGTVTDEQAERIGYTLMRLEERMNELLDEFGLEHEDLNIDLGPLGPLLDT